MSWGGGGGGLRGHDVLNFALSAECKLTFGTIANRSFERPRSTWTCSVSVCVQFQCVLKTSRDCFKFFVQCLTNRV